ncbi:MAG: hypothetical protein Q4B85_12285 [Lachnospiraceae bacterium]|nr:hypothetical protein [Lachnospiraceae bacterium]
MWEKYDLPFLVKISIDDLNIRSGPGVNNAKTGKYTGKGIFSIIQVAKGSEGAMWGRLESGEGWICLDHATYVNTGGNSTIFYVTPYQVKVSVPDLNIRKGPGMNYPKTGQYTGVGIFTIVAKAKGSEGAMWGLLYGGKGWICLDHAPKYTPKTDILPNFAGRYLSDKYYYSINVYTSPSADEVGIMYRWIKNKPQSQAKSCEFTALGSNKFKISGTNDYFIVRKVGCEYYLDYYKSGIVYDQGIMKEQYPAP